MEAVTGGKRSQAVAAATLFAQETKLYVQTAAIENIKPFRADLGDVSGLLAQEKKSVKRLCLS